MRVKKVWAVVGAIAVSASLLMASLAFSAGGAATRVTIRGDNGDFHGKIFSTKRICLGHRTVKVYKLTGNAPDPSTDLLVGQDTSQRIDDTHGVWSAGNTGRKRGDFYAHVGRTPDCKADNSPILSE